MQNRQFAKGGYRCPLSHGIAHFLEMRRSKSRQAFVAALIVCYFTTTFLQQAIGSFRVFRKQESLFFIGKQPGNLEHPLHLGVSRIAQSSRHIGSPD